MDGNRKDILSLAPVTAPLLVALVLILLSLSGKLLEGRRSDDNIFLLISVIQLIVFIFPCVLYYFIKGRKLSTPMFVSAVKPGQFLFLLFAFLAMITGTILIKFFYFTETGAAPTEVNFFISGVQTDENTSMLEIIVAFVLVPAVCEELFFRGIILSEYRAFGSLSAVLFSAICFSMAHFSFSALPIYFFNGLILGTAAIACRSVFAPILIHIGSNLLSIYASDLFLRVTVQKCGVFFVFFVLAVAFLLSVILMLSRAESIFWNRSANPPESELPPRSAGTLKTVFLSPAFFVLVFVFVIITILV